MMTMTQINDRPDIHTSTVRAERLNVGDTINPDLPPTHCGYEMNIYDTEGYGWALDCINDDCAIGTDEHGVINELYPTGLKR